MRTRFLAALLAVLALAGTACRSDSEAGTGQNGDQQQEQQQDAPGY